MTGERPGPAVPRRDLLVVDVVAERCSGCGACLPTCPTRALVAAPGRPAVLVERCTGCLACIEVCPRDAIAEVEWS